MKYNAPSWPRPAVLPASSLTFLVINIIITYSIDAFSGNIWWVLPGWALNLFFFWAEHNIYVRERRNYDGWNEEMKVLLDNPQASREAIWGDGVRAVHRRKRRKNGSSRTQSMSNPRTA